MRMLCAYYFMIMRVQEPAKRSRKASMRMGKKRGDGICEGRQRIWIYMGTYARGGYHCDENTSTWNLVGVRFSVCLYVLRVRRHYLLPSRTIPGTIALPVSAGVSNVTMNDLSATTPGRKHGTNCNNQRHM